MTVKVVCPSCHIALDAPENILGQTVKCEECGSTFTARASARPKNRDEDRPTRSRSRIRDDDDDDRPRRSSRRRDDDDDDDDFDTPRPKRRNTKKKGASPLPYILAGGFLLLFILVAGGVGAYLVFGSSSTQTNQPPVANNNNAMGFAPMPGGNAKNPNQQPPRGVGNAPAVGIMKFTLSNPRWSGGFSNFEVSYQTQGGQRPIGVYSLKWKYNDGTTGSANLHMSPFDGGSGTWKINVIGFGRGANRQGMEMWVEEGGIGPVTGTRVSNTVTLR